MKTLKKLIPIIFTILLIMVSIIPYVSSESIETHITFELQFEPLDIDWWPMFHDDADQNGFSTSSAPDTKNLLWSYQTDYLITSSPNVVDGKVFIGSLDKKFYCFDMTNGNELWNFSTKGQITGSSAVNDGKVFFGSQDSNFYCLDADNGSKIWAFDTNFMIESSPTVKNNKVFFGSSDGSLYCLDENNGNFIWEFSAGNVIWTAPAVSNDRLYFGSLSGDLFCLDIVDGGEIWSYSTASGIWSSPALYNGSVYFGSNDNYVYCLDEDDGSLIWNYNTEGEVHSSPAIAYGNVYIGSSGQGLYCLDANTGNLVWQFLINNGIWSSPAVADNKVFYGNDPCCGTPAYFHCSDAFTGDMVWQYNIGGEIGMKSSPAIAAGKVFIGAGNGMVFAFGENELYADAHGPYTALKDESIQFKGSAYGGKPDYIWQWDFGNGETSNQQNPIHNYSTKGNYIVKLVVTDDYGNEAIDETIATIEEDINYPPTIPIIEGPQNGKIGQEYTYCIPSIIDPDGDDIYVYWDWGDGTNSDWIGPYMNGEQICKNHSWEKTGEFTIKAKLKDEYGLESDWGYLDISMPKSRLFNYLFIVKFFERFFNHFPILIKILDL
ncbi:MAG: hypothetical protein AYK22_02485 [Thermoplasmatales archaeon SG8-52-3]|nr:MAG: hypothetical protein AYK22_02485 [Thermoplasmatales archaeon SG8-52-3]